MASITDGRHTAVGSARSAVVQVAAGLCILAGVLSIGATAALAFGGGALAAIGLGTSSDPVALGALGAAGLFLTLGGALIPRRAAGGGGVALTGAVLYVAGLLLARSFGYALAVPLVLGFVGSIAALVVNDVTKSRVDPRLVYRQAVLTRVTHWTWAIALFFLLLSGLQIWNAYPALNIGNESGFEYDNAILRIGAENTPDGPRGYTILFGQKFDTTGLLGMSGPEARPQFVGFPGWATIPSFRDLATGRVVHFFFAWVLVGALAVWLVSSLANRHLWRDIVLRPRDLRDLPRDVLAHLRFRFSHGRTYSPLQKLAYFVVFVVLFPLVILTGLTMSPGMDAAWPWLLDIFGGRQTARTLHFLAMVLLVLFFLVHVVMVVLAGPLNEMRSMITGYYRSSDGTRAAEEERK